MKTKHNLSIITEIIINANAEIIWQLLTNLNNYGKWNPFICKAEGIIYPGNRLKNTLQFETKTVVFKPTVKQVNTLEYFDWVGTMGSRFLFSGHHYFKIETINASQIKLTQGENFDGILSSFIFNKISKQTRNQFILMNKALKIEAEKKYLK